MDEPSPAPTEALPGPIAEEPAPIDRARAADGPTIWRERLRARLFDTAILLGEAALVLASGGLVDGVLALIHYGRLLPPLGAMAGAYAILVLLGGGLARPPRRVRKGVAIRVMGAVFLVALLVIGDFWRLLLPMGVWFCAAVAAVVAWRRMAVRLGQALPALSPPKRRMAFIGNSEAAARLLEQIWSDPQGRLQPIGFFDDRQERIGPLHGKLPHLGAISELVSYIQDRELQDVFVALPWTAGQRISELIERLRFLPLNVRLIPDRSLPALRQRNVHQLEGVVMPTLMVPPFSKAGAAAKRGLDLAVAAVLVVPLGLLFVAVAALIKLDSRGSVFFMQQRSGQYGQQFDIFKFRSLHVARADSAAETLVGKGDSRVTRVGKYLRKYSIDELPQIFNVLLGDMSLVGPRPHAARAKADGRLYAEVMPQYMLRYRVKPGMTGWAQVNGWRGNTDTEEKLRKRVEFDFEYIDGWSMTGDLRILVRTIPSMLFPPADNV